MPRNHLVEETLKKLGAYGDIWGHFQFYVLGNFCWVKERKKDIWIIKTVRKSEVLHEFLQDLIWSAHEFDYYAGLDAEAFARFVKSGRYTSKFGLSMKQAS